MAENTNTAGDAITAENNFSDLQRHAAIQDARISNLETKFEMFMQSIDRNLAEMRERDKIRADELQDFKNEMRQQNAMRAAENKELRDSIKEIYQTTDAKIGKIESKIDSTNQHIRNLSYASIGAIAAMVITVLLNLPK